MPRPDFTDVSAMVRRGFLIRRGRIAGLDIVWKTVNNQELDRITAYAGDTSNSWLAYFLAHSIVMLNGVDILNARPNYIYDLATAMENIPLATKMFLFHEMRWMADRAGKALDMVEAYSVSSDSKMCWEALQGKFPNDPAFTGWPGTERIGLNTVQILWTAIMRGEDYRKEHRSRWESAKLVSRFLSPKDVQRLDRHEDEARKADERRRHQLLTGEKLTPEGYVIIQSAETVEELEEQIRKDLAGELDDHDKAILASERVSDDRAAQMREKLRERAEKVRKEHENLAADMGVVNGKAMTADELREYMRRRKEIDATVVPSMEPEDVMQKPVNRQAVLDALRKRQEGSR